MAADQRRQQLAQHAILLGGGTAAELEAGRIVALAGMRCRGDRRERQAHAHVAIQRPPRQHRRVPGESLDRIVRLHQPAQRPVIRVLPVIYRAIRREVAVEVDVAGIDAPQVAEPVRVDRMHEQHVEAAFEQRIDALVHHAPLHRGPGEGLDAMQAGLQHQQMRVARPLDIGGLHAQVRLAAAGEPPAAAGHRAVRLQRLAVGDEAAAQLVVAGGEVGIARHRGQRCLDDGRLCAVRRDRLGEAIGGRAREQAQHAGRDARAAQARKPSAASRPLVPAWCHAALLPRRPASRTAPQLFQ